MEQNSTNTRFNALDGIRGLAMIFVFLNHVNPAPLTKLLPPQLGLLGQTIFASGVLGVSFLFILSGFFMAYIYASPKSNLGFLQKRYSRIFPLFLTMCTVMLTLNIYPHLAWYVQIPMILGYALVTHIFWVYIVKKTHAIPLSKILFICFIILQVVMGLIYVLKIGREPAIVFNQQTPFAIREGVIGLVNGTLTLPLGDYIPMLDGVYWSLAAEVFFYILYPFLCAPVIGYLSLKRRAIKILYLIVLIPFFMALNILSYKIFILSLFQLPLFYYFVTGMALGYIYHRHPHKINNLHLFYSGWKYILPIIFLITFIPIGHTLLNTVPTAINPLIHILWAIPFTYLIALALDKETSLAKILSTKQLVYIGTISYSIYLSHTAIIHMMEAIYTPKNAFSTTIFLLSIFAITLVIASILYHLLEKPYFMRSKQEQKAKVEKVWTYSPKAVFSIWGIIAIAIIGIFSAYESNFNFFSLEIPTANSAFIYPHVSSSQKKISLRDYPNITLRVTANDNNFGIITIPLAFTNKSKQKLLFNIKDDTTSSIYAQSSYLVPEIGEGSYLPFGFPEIADAKDKVYDIHISLQHPSSSNNVTIDMTKAPIETVYQLNKSTTIKHPQELIKLVTTRVMNVVTNPDARNAFFLLLPFILASLYIIYFQRRPLAKI